MSDTTYEDAKTHPELVMFSPNDTANPKNWSRNAKRLNVMMVCVLVFVAVIGSSLYAPAEAQIRRRYGVSADVGSLGLTLYVLGFAIGPLLWGPISEMYGRKWSYMVAWPFFIICLTPSAWADDVLVIILFRFFAGACASAPLNNGPAVIADLYSEVDMERQAVAANYFALSGFCAPVVGPVIGAFISTRLPNELWVLRVQLFLAIAAYPIVFLLPETHGPTILAARARQLRAEGNPCAWAHHELHQKTTAQLMRTNLIRPMAMLTTEPIVMGAAVWTSLSYGVLYFSFESYPKIFIEQHGIPPQFAGLPFIAIAIGMFIAVIPYTPLVRFFQALKLPSWLGHAANDPQSPESRLKLALLACTCLPISSFWLAWSSGPETHWIVPTLSGVVFGFANIVIFFTFVTYTNNIFTLYTASAGAANVFARSVVGCICPVLSHIILGKLGTKWGISLFGFLSLGLFPIPLIFLRYGERLRSRSVHAREAQELMRMMEVGKESVNDSMDSVEEKVAVSVGEGAVVPVLEA